MDIIDYKDFNIDNIIYLPCQNVDNENKYIKMKYINSYKPILIQTPYLYIPLGICKNTMNNLHFLNIDIIDEEFENILNNMDKKIINDSEIKKSDWQLNDEFIYEKILKNDYNTPYIISHLPKNENNKWLFEMYDYDKQIINIDVNLISDIYLRCILLLDGLWFSDNKYGLSIKLIQVQKKIVPDNSNFFLFKD